ncbi:MAG TPA: DUF6690 family protein [Pirellulales bacterium]|jgi:hypothetical protein|nr:DUF6690 family protein [Pirellulales bacterium]
MIKRSTVLFAVLSAAGVPYLASTRLGETTPAVTETQPAALDSGQTGPGEAADFEGARPGVLTPVEIQQLPQALRFDITIGWILGHWSRVSTALAELDLQGYRVALVTGTTEGDLAGSLTYYFDKQQRLERITFSGSTGDPRPLVRVLAGQFQFAYETTDDPSQYVYRERRKKKIAGELRLKPAPVVRSQDARARFAVNFTIERPE